MKFLKSQIIIACAVAFFAANGALADDHAFSVEQASTSSELTSGMLDDLWSTTLASSPVPVQAPRLTDRHRPNEVPLYRIEAPPSSGALFLSAMLSLGLWQVVRSSRDIHMAAMPDWYHTGGPVQIGHSTPCDLNYDNLVLCPFEEVDDGRLTPCVTSWVHFNTNLVAQCLHASVAGPRAPPIRTLQTFCS